MEDNTSKNENIPHSSLISASTSTETPIIPRRGRARSTTFSFETSPLDTPLTSEEQSLAKLIAAINLENGSQSVKPPATPRPRNTTPVMNYQNFETVGPSPRQAPQTPSNGMNGGNMGIGAMVGFP